MRRLSSRAGASLATSALPPSLPQFVTNCRSHDTLIVTATGKSVKFWFHIDSTGHASLETPIEGMSLKIEMGRCCTELAPCIGGQSAAEEESAILGWMG